MKKMYLMMAAVAGILAACSGNEAEVLENAAGVSKNTPEAPVPVEFGAYVNRATTRAGMTGVLENGTPNTSEDSRTGLAKGFGVFAYYTDDDLYSQIYQPNFMYNTKVYSTASNTWTYTPIRYWPNETGGGAISDGIDRLSFFAYAPYVEVDPTTGIVSGDGVDADHGIVGLTRNAAIGDPFVKYNVNLDPNSQVDFCWGVSAISTLSSVETLTNNSVTAGKPFLNLIKPNVSDKIKFDFKHALASLNVQIDGAFDEVSPSSTDIDNNTKIYVRKITFEGFVLQGSFNLNTDKATWYDLAGTSYINGGSVTIYDGRTDGREGTAQGAASNESPTGLNKQLIQTNETTIAGVKKTAVNLFDDTNVSSNKDSAPLFVIPSGQALKVTIVYDVETKTDELPTYVSDGTSHGTSIENTITKTIQDSSSKDIKLESGKKYTIKLHLGMTSVKFDASVSNWDTPEVNGSANLPANKSN